MRARLEAMWERIFPGMGLRPTYLTALSTWLLCLYWYNSSARRTPEFFIDGMRDLTGITEKGFHRHLYSHLLCLVLLMIVPLIFARVVDGMKLKDLGLGFRSAGREFVVVTVLYLLFVPVIFYFSTTAGFQKMYPRLALAEVDPTIFVLFHLAYLVKWTAWEFFFRGFMLFAFYKDMGTRAVLISTIPFTLAHYGKPDMETLSAVFAGFILCWLAIKGRSIWPGVFLHAAVAATMELFATRWFWELF